MTRRDINKPVRPDPPKEGYPQRGRGRDRVKRQSKQWEEVERVDGLPSLPDPDYPDGTLVLNEQDTVLYRQKAGSWVASGDALGDLSDVNLSGAADGDYLKRQSGTWQDFTPPFPKTELPSVTAYEDKANVFTIDQSLGDNVAMVFGDDDDFSIEYDEATNDRLELKAGLTDAIRVSGGGAVSLPATTSLDVDITGDADSVDGLHGADLLQNPLTDDTNFGIGSDSDYRFRYATGSTAFIFEQDQAPYAVVFSIQDGSLVVDFASNPTVGGTQLVTANHEHSGSDITSGTVAKSRLPSTTMYEDKANQISSGNLGLNDSIPLGFGSDDDFEMRLDQAVDGRWEFAEAGGGIVMYVNQGSSKAHFPTSIDADIDGDADTLDGKHASEFVAFPVNDDGKMSLGTDEDYWWVYDSGSGALELVEDFSLHGGAGTVNILSIDDGTQVVDFTNVPKVAGTDLLQRGSNETITGEWTFEGGSYNFGVSADGNRGRFTTSGDYFYIQGENKLRFSQHGSSSNIAEILASTDAFIIGSDPGGGSSLRVGGQIGTNSNIEMLRGPGTTSGIFWNRSGTIDARIRLESDENLYFEIDPGSNLGNDRDFIWKESGSKIATLFGEGILSLPRYLLTGDSGTVARGDHQDGLQQVWRGATSDMQMYVEGGHGRTALTWDAEWNNSANSWESLVGDGQALIGLSNSNPGPGTSGGLVFAAFDAGSAGATISWNVAMTVEPNGDVNMNHGSGLIIPVGTWPS